MELGRFFVFMSLSLLYVVFLVSVFPIGNAALGGALGTAQVVHPQFEGPSEKVLWYFVLTEAFHIVSVNGSTTKIRIVATKNTPVFFKTQAVESSSDTSSKFAELVRVTRDDALRGSLDLLAPPAVKYKPPRHFTGKDEFCVNGISLCIQPGELPYFVGLTPSSPTGGLARTWSKPRALCVIERRPGAPEPVLLVEVIVRLPVTVTSYTSLLDVKATNNTERTTAEIASIQEFLKTSNFLKTVVRPNDLFASIRSPVCAVVGNGAVLHQSGCGKQIDSADLVFRFNRKSILEKYWQAEWASAGRKVDALFLNRNVLGVLPDVLRDVALALNNTAPLNGHKKILIVLSIVKAAEYAQVHRVLATTPMASMFDPYDATVELLLLSTDWTTMADEMLFGKKCHRKFASTGFLGALVAFTLCETLHLYGFGKLPGDPKEHYFNDTHVKAWDGHSMDLEHVILDRIAANDIPTELLVFDAPKTVVFHKGPCSSNGQALLSERAP